jgi:alkanesulfonate monooxygenase SsuD/methylene tetrahydromethanopterin reductase-like flavin-dependent oxidoreductase (luciferase family)
MTCCSQVGDMKFGVRLPQDGPFASKENIVKVAKLAEQLDYDSVWVHDHTHWPYPSKYHLSAGTKEAVDKLGNPPYLYETLVTLAYVGSITEHVKLGTAAIIAPLRNPLLLANQLSTLGALTDSRMIMSFCLGGGEEASKEYEMFNVPWNRRGRIMEETLKILREVCFEEGKKEHSFQGRIFKFDGYVMYPKCKPFPIWYAGRSEEALERASRLADGWLPGLNQTVGRFKKDLPVLESYLKKQGRDLSKFTIGLETFVNIGNTSEEVQSATSATFKERGISDQSWTFCGTTKEISERLEALKNVGVQYFELKFMSHNLDKMLNDIRAFSSQIVPSWT